MSYQKLDIKDINDKTLNLPERMSFPLWLLSNLVIAPFSFLLSGLITFGTSADVVTIPIDEAKREAYLKYLMGKELSDLLLAKNDTSLSFKSRRVIKLAIDKKAQEMASKNKADDIKSSLVFIDDNFFCVKLSDLLREINLQAPDRIYNKSQDKKVVNAFHGMSSEKNFLQGVTVGDIDNILTLYAPDYQNNPEQLDAYISFVKSSFEKSKSGFGVYCYPTAQPEKGIHHINISNI